MESVNPHGQNNSFSRSNKPQSKPHFCQKISWTSVKTLAMEQVGPHGQTAHFQVQTNLRADLSYGACWPSQPKRPIFKVKRTPEKINPHFACFLVLYFTIFFGDPKFWPYFSQNFTRTSVNTLAIEPVCPHCQNGPFSRSNKPPSNSQSLLVIRNFDHILPKNFMDVRKDLSYGAIRPSQKKWLIFKVKRSSEQSIDFLVIKNYDLIFAKNLHGCPLRPYLSSQLSLMAKTAYLQGQTNPGSEFRPHFCQNFTWTSVKTLAIEPIGPHGKNGQFSRSYEPQRTFDADWPSLPNWPISKVKRASEKVKPPFYQFSCAIVHGNFGDPEFQPHFCQNITWTSVKTFAIEPVGAHSQNGPF
ncbi:hypothetical protein H5410_044076 [Solanum commersonii]|uniref:Uncharacterized protein n=1 Tax=Solanum commersonii TaxID=4109 RepID=A0A9J5Y0R1_SOLCO|nr:hypothetical protein H5410_044076 [Solanum commersonii]